MHSNNRVHTLKLSPRTVALDLVFSTLFPHNILLGERERERERERDCLVLSSHSLGCVWMERKMYNIIIVALVERMRPRGLGCCCCLALPFSHFCKGLLLLSSIPYPGKTECASGTSNREREIRCFPLKVLQQTNLLGGFQKSRMSAANFSRVPRVCTFESFVYASVSSLCTSPSLFKPLLSHISRGPLLRSFSFPPSSSQHPPTLSLLELLSLSLQNVGGGGGHKSLHRRQSFCPNWPPSWPLHLETFLLSTAFFLPSF